jgi:hypothetical protein
MSSVSYLDFRERRESNGLLAALLLKIFAEVGQLNIGLKDEQLDLHWIIDAVPSLRCS